MQNYYSSTQHTSNSPSSVMINITILRLSYPYAVTTVLGLFRTSRVWSVFSKQANSQRHESFASFQNAAVLVSFNQVYSNIITILRVQNAAILDTFFCKTKSKYIDRPLHRRIPLFLFLIVLGYLIIFFESVRRIKMNEFTVIQQQQSTQVYRPLYTYVPRWACLCPTLRTDPSILNISY